MGIWLAKGMALYGVVLLLAGCLQRKLLYFPTHRELSYPAPERDMQAWMVDGKAIGVCREVENPQRVWLMFHGNGGQAAHREYVLPLIHETDSLYVLEYPGYGTREGKPSEWAFNEAARDAYTEIRRMYSETEVCILGESLGSGPACHITGMEPPPDRLVLVVPFDRLKDVAQDKFPIFPVGLIMVDRWDNIEALADYQGRIDIYAGRDDKVIPPRHARNLADLKEGSTYHEFDAGHNDWAHPAYVDLKR